MTITEVKKLLYRQNPTAFIDYIKDGVVYYACRVDNDTRVEFEVPFRDMGGTRFSGTMPAKHLIKWISNFTVESPNDYYENPIKTEKDGT